MDPRRELLFLRQVRDLSHSLSSESDPRQLLSRILDAAIELTDAERGYLVRVQGRKPNGAFRFKIEVARGFDKEALGGAAGEVSRTVVKRVCERGGQGLVTTDQLDAGVLEVSSVRAQRVLSIVSVPLRLRGEVRGVLYLDHRFDRAAFGSDDLPMLQTFADQAALTLETAELRAGRARDQEALGKTLAELQALKQAGASFDPEQSSDEERSQQAPRLRFGSLVGSSPAMSKLYAQIEGAARTWGPVLISGESGSGKAQVARELHARGSFPGAPFVRQRLRGAGEAELAQELFGSAGSPGLFQRVERGCVYLDGVEALSLGLQDKLLQVLEQERFLPLGAERAVELECRLVVSAREELKPLVARGVFRAELYYRLDVLRLRVPPLREREGDVLLLLDQAFEAAEAKVRLSAHAQKLLRGYAWPGNVRELQNEARRLAALDVRRLSAQHLSEEIRAGRGLASGAGKLAGKTLEDVERDMVARALEEAGGNKSRAARQLGVPRTTFYHLLKRYGLS